MDNCKIIFLGAGASKDAGYPLMTDLFKSLDDHYKSSPYQQKRNDWREFKRYRSSSRGRIGSILKCDNLELALTLPDLLSECLNEFDRITDESSLLETNLIKRIKRYFDRVSCTERHQLREANRIKRLFVELIEDYFNYRSYQNNSANGVPEYYKKMLGNFDTVISANWDSLAERTLYNADEWHPSDGYGVKVKNFDRSKSSLKKIYKLHGGVGWRSRDNNFCLDENFIKYLTNQSRDKYHPPDLNQQNLFITPSYLKQLNNSHLIEIWQKASKALIEAKEISIVGYSLPSADVAIRSLLLPIIGKKVEVISLDTDDKVKRQWDGFLGEDRYNFVNKTAEEYFNSNSS